MRFHPIKLITFQMFLITMFSAKELLAGSCLNLPLTDLNKSLIIQQIISDSLKEYITISEFVALYVLPFENDTLFLHDGKQVMVKGFIDYKNVFDKKKYPNLPYEKFSIHDSTKTHIIEVWSSENENSALFDKIYNAKSNEKKTVYLNAIIKEVIYHVSTGPKRWIKFIILNENDLLIK